MELGGRRRGSSGSSALRVPRGLAGRGFGVRVLAARLGCPLCGAVQFCQLGEIYPFVPSVGEQQRDNEHELRLKAQIGQDLPVEP